MKQNLEKEFEEKYYYPIKFNEIKKLILATEDFYREKKPENFDVTILYGFYRTLASYLFALLSPKLYRRKL